MIPRSPTVFTTLNESQRKEIMNPNSEPTLDLDSEASPSASPPVSPAPSSPPSLPDGIRDLYKDFGGFGNKIKLEAEAAYHEFLAGLPNLKLLPEEADDVRWATHRLAVVGLQRIGAGPEELARLEQGRRDALSVLADISACRLNDVERLLSQSVARIFAKAQDLVLGFLTKAVAVVAVTVV